MKFSPVTTVTGEISCCISIRSKQKPVSQEWLRQDLCPAVGHELGHDLVIFLSSTDLDPDGFPAPTAGLSFFCFWGLSAK